MPQRILKLVNSQAILEPIAELRPRGSLSDFCPVAFMLNYWTVALKDRPLQSLTMRQDLLFEVGHVIHEIWQKWLGVAGVLYGDWECFKCRTTERGFNIKCPRCGRLRRYQELSYRKPFGVNIDGPVRIAPQSGPPDSLWELKSTAQELWRKLEEPKSMHVTQAQCYAEALVRNEGFPIKQIVVCYINRNRPHQAKVFVSKLKKVQSKIMKKFKRATVRAERGKFSKENYWDPDDYGCRYCDWSNVCASPVRNRIMKNLYTEYRNANSN